MGAANSRGDGSGGDCVFIENIKLLIAYDTLAAAFRPALLPALAAALIKKETGCSSQSSRTQRLFFSEKTGVAENNLYA